METIKPEITELAPHTWCISEYKLVNAFLVEGKEKAALIDTGCGIGNIAECVKELTDKPLVILLTHGHADHCASIYQFPGCPVYMNSADEEILQKMPCSNLFRKFYIETRVPARFPGEGHVEQLLAQLPQDDPDGTFTWIPVEDGDTFDLGDRVLRAIHTPGHSDGSICYLDAQTRILFSGDTVNHGIVLMRQPENAPTLIQIYNASVAKLWACQEEYERLAIGHDGMLVEKAMVKDYLDLTAGLLDGSIVGAYEEVGIRKGDVARLGLAELWYQCDE